MQQKLLSFCTSETKSKEGKPQENAKLRFNLDFGSNEIKKRPLPLAQSGFSAFKAQTPSTLPEKPRHKVYPLIWGFVIWAGGGNQDKALDHAAQNMTTDAPKTQAGCMKQLKECLLFHDS